MNIYLFVPFSVFLIAQHLRLVINFFLLQYVVSNVLPKLEMKQATYAAAVSIWLLEVDKWIVNRTVNLNFEIISVVYYHIITSYVPFICTVQTQLQIYFQVSEFSGFRY